MLEAFTDITSIKDHRSRANLTKELLNSGLVDVSLAACVPNGLEVPPNYIIESLLLNAWLRPRRAFGNRIQAMGRIEKSRMVSSTTIEILMPDSVASIKMVIKQAYSRQGAEEEQRNLVLAHTQTKVRAIFPFAVMSFCESPNVPLPHHLILTILERGVVPVERLDFPNFHPNERRGFVNELAEFTALLGNEGLSHNDLHLGNIARDVSQESSSRGLSEFLLFDFESVKITDREIWQRMMTEQPKSTLEAMEFHRIGSRYVADGSEIAQILLRLGFSADYVESEYAQIYLKNRLPISDLMTDSSRLKFIMTGVPPKTV